MSTIKVTARASIQHFDYAEGERPPLGPPYRVVVKNEYGDSFDLTSRSTRVEARKVARRIKEEL